VARWSLTGIIACPRGCTSFAGDASIHDAAFGSGGDHDRPALRPGRPPQHPAGPHFGDQGTAGRPQVPCRLALPDPLATTQIALSTMLLILAGLFKA
jgi:hypothetical protein